MIKIYNYGEVSNEKIFSRENIANDVADIVSEIIENVKSNGDKALYEYNLKFDKAELESLEVSEDEINEAFEKVDSEFVEILKEASENI